tara:strand:+ start:1972 stop:2208 length:237 start_codon:yes stop_codon:yes gene_type:complete
MSRDYQKEYRDYHGTPEQRKRRSNRNKARRYMINQGRAKVGDGKHVDHKNYNADDNSPANLRVVSARANLKRQPKRKG